MNIQDQPKGSRERTLDEVKAEFMRRAGKLNPFEDIKREDAEKVMAALKSLDKDHWAEEWSKIGLGYEAKARRAGQDRRQPQASSPSSTCTRSMPAASGAIRRRCRPARSPPISYSLRMFRKAAKHFDPPLEIVEIPFEGKKLVGYLQKPPGVDQAAGGHALGRRRRLEGRPAEDRRPRS